MPSFCEYRNCHNLASSTFMGYCNEYHMNRAMATDPNWLSTSAIKDMFEVFELQDKKRLEPKPKAKEISNLQVRPLVKPSEK
jgi:hypothetical protein